MRLADRLRGSPALLHESRARVWGSGRMRTVCAGALRTANAATPDELARAVAGAGRAQNGRAAIRTAYCDQFGRVQWPASVHLLWLVRVRMFYRRKSHGVRNVFG